MSRSVPSVNGAEGISDIEGKVARVSGEGVGQRPSFKSMVRLLHRDCRERRDRFVDYNPRQFIFEEDRFLRRKRCRIVERCHRHIDCVGIFGVLEKQMRATTCGKRTNPIRIRNLARFTLCHGHILARHRSPLHIRRTSASPAIDAMTIYQRKWTTLQHVSCPAANASTSDLHIICLAHFNHEFTRTNTNFGSACASSARCGVPPQRTSRKNLEAGRESHKMTRHKESLLQFGPKLHFGHSP